MNPYLPLTHYIPDGEPRLFGDRLYLYGSHDFAHGDFFCLGDYEVWSAHKDYLTQWRCDGVAYRRGQDPADPDGKLELFAPDVVQGIDGRFYLYYCLRMRRAFGVAVSDTPEGPFTFYSNICRPDGSIFCDYMPYDPSVLVDDDGRVYLYYGFSSPMLAEKFDVEVSPGALVVELCADMCTTKGEPHVCIPWEGTAAGTDFEQHAYFEAPSMRKLGGLYYLVYSSQWCHELCYAVSQFPTHGFRYGGIIIDNADLGFEGRTEPACMPGNNHGGLVCVEGQAYIFYHRHTNCTSFSRQGCAERITIQPNGAISQVDITCCGLSASPLPATGSYCASIACHLTGSNPALMHDFRNADPAITPFITEEETANGALSFVHNLQNDAIVGYKYFYAGKTKQTLTLSVRGTANGTISAHLDSPNTPVQSCVNIQIQNTDWTDVSLPLSLEGTHALYLSFAITGALDICSLHWDNV